MILDSYFAFAAVVLLGLLIALAVIAVTVIRGLREELDFAVAGCDAWANEAEQWQQAYERRDAQLQAARERLEQIGAPAAPTAR